MKQNLNPIRGFRDLYPNEKATQTYIFGKIRQAANIFGFEEYDGPILEPISLYLDKTSKELIDRQTFQVITKKDETLILRPEMTPSLARMIAQKGTQMSYPAKLFNLGLRFRYEAPQKGRAREFYQADFDILGVETMLADTEILNVAVNIFLNLGAGVDDFIININSRELINSRLVKIGTPENKIPAIIGVIDKKDKVADDIFKKMLVEATDKNLALEIIEFLNSKKDFESYFEELFKLLKKWGIDKYVSVDPSVVRGLDYYTGLVFEIKAKNGMGRSLLGGGRYDNLIESFNSKLKISGVGFATSDVVLEEFLRDCNLLPEISALPTKVLVAVFKNFEDKSIAAVNALRENSIASEIYLKETDVTKQVEYANKKNIPFVIFIGAEEIKKNVVKLKNMKTGEQQNITLENLISKLSS